MEKSEYIDNCMEESKIKEIANMYAEDFGEPLTDCDTLEKCKKILEEHYNLKELQFANNYSGVPTYEIIQELKKLSHGDIWGGTRENYEIEFFNKDISEFDQINNKPSNKFVLITCASTRNGTFQGFDNFREFRNALKDELKEWF
jgi:hypothetical protein